MRTWTMRLAAVVLVLAPAARADDTTKTAKTEKKEKMPAAQHGEMGKAVFVSADSIQWGEPPPDLPRGAKLGVLYGAPTKAGAFVVRLKMPDGYKIPAHWHSQDEALTIISGSFMLRMGDMPSGEAHTLKQGDFHYLPAKSRHSAEAKGETIVQINGNGPFDLQKVGMEKPNPKSAKR
jgi:quercetin dioxygenase-like cupin family protein